MLPPRWEEVMSYKSRNHNKRNVFTGKCTTYKWILLMSCFCLKIMEEVSPQAYLSAMEVITENQSSSLHALQVYNEIVHAWPVFWSKGKQGFLQRATSNDIRGGGGRGASSAKELQFQELEIRNQYRFPLPEPLSSVNAFQSEVSLYFSLANNRVFFPYF